MSGLVAYGSSDEDDVDEVNGGEHASETTVQANDTVSATQIAPPTAGTGSSSTLQSLPSNGAAVGPIGPPQEFTSQENTLFAPSSPYSSQRARIRDLTLPTDPNLNIPPSPPGTPAPGADQKFAHFLELKNQGVHFNAKLASSSALKNPSLLPKLMDFAGLEEQKQYATTLPIDIWDPAAFPSWAYREELAKAQQEILKSRKEEKAKSTRESIDFVSASNSHQSSSGGTPGIGAESKTIRGSAAERVMAGLDREKKASPQGHDAGLKREVDRRGGRVAGVRPGANSSSSTQLKRSRSR